MTSRLWARAAPVLAALACAPLLAATSPATAQVTTQVTAQATTQTSTAPTSVAWLSTGDSYSSGEGITGTGALNSADYCAQSNLAYGPRAAELLRTKRGWDIPTTAFSACTGHLFGDWYNESTPGKGSLWEWTQEQVGDDTRFDVATFSFGGNDIGFAPVLGECLGIPSRWSELGRVANRDCGRSEQELLDRIDALEAGTPFVPDASLFGPPGEGPEQPSERLSVAQFYTRFANTHLHDDGVLVVAGYPRLFAPSSSWPNWRNGRCNTFSATDADMLGRVGERLDAMLRRAVTEAQASLQGGRRITFLSRMELFGGQTDHSLCGKATEWLNGVSVGFWDSSLRPQHSFHPNDLGHAATAELLATTVETELAPAPPVELAAPPQPVEPEQPAEPEQPTAPEPPQQDPIEDPAADFDIGDAFDDYCINAWPTAPSYTSTSIIMTMRCINQPQQYLFVQVQFPDPDLPVTPNTGQMRVRGTIVDASRSGFGFRQLIVAADEIDLP